MEDVTILKRDHPMNSYSKSEQRGMVCVEQVFFSRLDRDGNDRTILTDISFSALRGEITAIVGPSGGGKSSLIRLINRLNDPTAGNILLDGKNIRELDPLVLRRQVAMVQQKPFMFEGTVLTNLQRPFLFRESILPDAVSSEVRLALELAQLKPEYLERDARSLSVGEQQRVSLARALVTGPAVLLLDEPTSALDRPTGDRLAATLQEICGTQQLTAILVTHDLRLAGKADKLIFLEGGRIREQGTPEQLLKAPGSMELRRFLDAPQEAEGVDHG